MEYPLIDIKSIFIYKSLPPNMNDRVIKLPTTINIPKPPSTGFSKIDAQLKAEVIKSIDWQQLPERNLTQCALVDTFATLVHQHGHQRLSFYAKAMGNRYNALVLGHAIMALMGITANQFVIQYTMMMIRDIEKRTNLNQTEIASVLGFTCIQTFYQFMCIHGKKYP